MKQLLSVIITLTICLPIVAQNITEEQALQKAQAFMQGKVMNNSNGRNGAPARPRAMKRVAQAIQSDALYIFNVEDNGGYVIVSGDERTDEILGYSTEGHIDPQQMPENMRAWIEGYEEQIKAIPTSYKGSPAKLPTHPAVEPLITAKWNQGAPYNLQCPEQIPEGGTEPVHCVTGCTATALAQIMYYHKWPKDATTTIPAYNYGKWVYDEETGDGHNEYHEDELPPTTFEWDLMKDSYDYNDTGAEAQAVAKLMRYCGQAVTMNYTPSASGAHPNPQPLIEYFGYDEHARIVYSGYGIAVWDSIIYHEIESRRPVWHTGNPGFNKEGHCFVLDGYDGNGYFHVNWGWGGYGDGFYTINRLTPNGSGIGGAAEGDSYSYGQGAVIGIMPPGSPSEPQESVFGLLCSIPSIKSGDGMSGPYTVLTYSLMTRTNEIIDFDAGIRIEGVDGTDYEETRILDLIPSSAGGWAMEVKLDALPYGHYRFTPLWRLTDTMEWQECNRHFFISKEGDNSGDYKLVYNYNLTASIEVEGSLVTNREQKVKVSLTNHGDEIYQKPLYLCLSSSEEGIIKNFTEYLYIEENGTDFFTYSFWPQQSGTYHVSVVFDGQSIGEADFEVTNGIEVNCGVSCNYEEDKLLLDIWNNDTRAYNHPLLLKIWTAGHDKSTAVEYVTDQLSVPAGGYVKVEIPSSRELSLDSLYYYELNYYPNPDNDVATYYTTGMITDCDGSSVLLNELNDNAFVIADQSQHLACINRFFSDEEYAFLPGRVANDGQLYTVKSVSDVRGLFANLIVGEGIVNTLFSITNDQLKSVTLPSTLKNVRYYVFSHCTNIDAIYMKSTVPPKIYDWEGKTSDIVLYATDENGYDVSYQGYKQTMLYVPTGCSGVYRNASGWGQFANIVEMNVDDMPSTTNIDDQPQDDIDLSQYTLVKDLDLGSYGNANNQYNLITIDLNDQRGTAWNRSNKNYPKIYNTLTPEDWHDVLAFQAVLDESLGKGWFIYKDQGIYSKGADRSAAVLNRKAGDLVVFETTKESIEDVMTLTNGNSDPDGPFTYQKSSDGKKYYVTMTGDGQLGFCSYHNNYPVITRITIYEPKVKPISNHILGDINDDGKVDVSDYIGVANHILGQTPEGFNEQAADVNDDGVIDVSDYIGVANIILTGSIYGNHQ